MIHVTFPDGASRPFEPGVSGLDIAKSISPSLAKRTVAMILDGALADLGVGAGTQAAGGVGTDVDALIGVAQEQSLRVGVDGDKLDAAESLLNHTAYRVAACATHADDFDAGEVLKLAASVGSLRIFGSGGQAR